MRKRAERQLPLNFAGTQKLTQDWYALYKDIHEILEQNPTVTDLVHAALTCGEKKLKRNVEGVASESILRLALVQQIEQRSFRGTIVRVDDSERLRFFCRFYDDPMQVRRPGEPDPAGDVEENQRIDRALRTRQEGFQG